MILYRLICGAITGWIAIVLGRPAPKGAFETGGFGFFRALVPFVLVCLLLALVLETVSGVGAMAAGTAVFVSGLFPLLLAERLARLGTRHSPPAATILVPGLFAMGPVMILGTLAVLLLPGGSFIALGIAGVLLTRLGVSVGWSRRRALVFAVICCLGIVVLGASLYMLAMPLRTSA